MSNPIQNFYKSTITQDWSIGPGNFYVSVKPTTSVGRLVVSPSSDTLREIIEYTSTGTDGNGDYIVISARGVGGTTEQTHTVGEKVRMNITAEDWEDMRDDIDSIVAAGAPNASTVQKGLVQEATSPEFIAGTNTGSTGAKLFATPSVIKANMAQQSITEVLTTESTSLGDSTTRFDITNPTGTTFRYTYDGTGTNPGISSITVPVGTLIDIYGYAFNVNNHGIFVVTGSGTNYFEVDNPSGIIENDKVISQGGYINISNTVWNKNSLGKLFFIELYGAGGGGSGGGNHTATTTTHRATGGAGGGYYSKLFKASELTESSYKYIVGKGGSGGAGTLNGATTGTIAGAPGGTSSVYPLIKVFGGGGGTNSTSDQFGPSGGSFLERGYNGSGGGNPGTTPFLFPYIGTSTSTLSLNSDNIGLGGGGCQSTVKTGNSEYGGAGGAPNNTNPIAGGSSLFAGAGGGNGGRQVGQVGGVGGIRGSYTNGGGPAAAAINTGLPSPDGVNPGDGGTGGSGSTTAGVPAGNGGNGAIQGGGGGGGGSSQNNGGGGNGGNGGRGEIIITTFF